MPKALPFTSADQILQGLIAQYGLEGPMAEHRLREHWTEIVGDQVAAHAQPDQIRFRKLYLTVDSSAWMQEMSFLKPMLLEKVNGALNRFRAGFHLQEIILRLGQTVPTPKQSAASPKNHRKS
jgi:predicted nucleic acid-binding Zn ribbon protein